MRKLVVLTGILCLVFGMAAVNQVSAIDVTVFDNLGAISDGTGIGYEKGETEPHTVPGAVWDLQSFNKLGTGADLSLKGGYDIKDGQSYSGTRYYSGNLFIATPGTPWFGAASPDLDYVGGTSGNAQITNNFGYNYVVQWEFTSATGGNYKVISIDENAILKKTSYLTPETFLDTNPWRYVSDATDGAVVYNTGTFTFSENSGIYELVLTNLLGLDEFKFATSIWLYYTYQCGNDIMAGHTFGSHAPLPPSALLLGTGLLGLVGLRRFRKI